MSADPKIISIEFTGQLEDVGAAACKAMPPGRRYRYKRAIQYTLEDGRTIASSERGETKPRLQANFDRTEKWIKEGAYFAIIRDGEFVGTKTCLSLSMR